VIASVPACALTEQIFQPPPTAWSPAGPRPSKDLERSLEEKVIPAITFAYMKPDKLKELTSKSEVILQVEKTFIDKGLDSLTGGSNIQATWGGPAALSDGQMGNEITLTWNANVLGQFTISGVVAATPGDSFLYEHRSPVPGELVLGEGMGALQVIFNMIMKDANSTLQLRGDLREELPTMQAMIVEMGGQFLPQ